MERADFTFRFSCLNEIYIHKKIRDTLESHVLAGGRLPESSKQFLRMFFVISFLPSFRSDIAALLSKLFLLCRRPQKDIFLQHFHKHF